MRTRIGWVKFRERKELLNPKRFSLKLKGMVYQSFFKIGDVVWE